MKREQTQVWTKWFIVLFLIAANSIPISSVAAKQQSTSSGKQVIVAFGDSNTQGTNWKANQYDEKSKWVTKLQQTRTVINSGVGGNTTENGRKRFSKDVLSKKPKAVIIMFGTNDAVLNANGQPRVAKARFESNLKYFTDTLKARKIEVILMTTIPVIQGNSQKEYYYSRYDQRPYIKYNGARQWHNSYNAIVRKVAKEKKVTLIDNYAVMTRSMKGITDRKLIDSGWIDSSGTHLTPKGAEVIYSSVNRVLHAKLAK